MKLLDYTLIGLLAGATPMAAAQTTASPEQRGEAVEKPVDCTGDACSNDEGLLFRLRTRSYDMPVTHGTDAHSSSSALQPDRRVSVATEQPGKATAMGKFSIDLPGGGVIWATEDPTLGQPELSVSAPTMVAFDGQRVTKPVQFYVRGNYPAFIKRLEISLYRSSDADLIEPIATVPLDVAAVSHTEWNGALPSKYPFRKGDELVYVLRAYGEGDSFDETYPRTLQLVSPEEAERGTDLLRNSVERSLGSAMSGEQAQTQSLLDTVFADNGLRQQNIALYGSRIRIQGRNVPERGQLTINGESYPIDLERKFVAEYLVPVGRHRFDIGVGSGTDAQEAKSTYTLDVDVTGRYFFGVGLADVTIAQNKVSGSGAAFANDTRYQDDVISDGRLAFYGKAKYAGKYLVTAQADTTQRDLDRLFNGFTEADPQDVFRRLDPDLYYPVYGDDSTTYRDVDTMGRFYLRVDWDKNQALWGNYSTGITGTEYAQYQRSLYGAALNWRSNATNRWGDPGSELRVFGSQAETAPGHNEFIGTGGSLYYLRHTDLLPGSDVVTLEIRDLTTGRTENRVVLQRGTDYEIDELQGRVLLTRPLAQITRENIPTLTRDLPLDGFEQRLIVDYEWVPSGFDADDVTAGFRGKHWFGNHVGVGATYVQENRAGEDYTLAGGDLTLQAGKGTYIKAEYAQTESFGAPVFFSDNGGLSFIQQNDTALFREGDAKSLEARANFKELGWTEQDWSIGAWWRNTSAGYSISRYDTGRPITEYGAELLGQFTPNLGLYTRYTRAESGAESLTQAQATLEWRVDDASTFSAEVRRVDQEGTAADAAGTLGALKYLHRFGSTLELYGIGQVTLDDDGGQYADNNALTLGGKYLYGNQSSVGAEATTGDRGEAATVNAEHRLTAEHSVYGAYTYSTDTTDYDSLFNRGSQNGWTLGQRWRLSNQVNLYNESQFLKERNASGLAHTFGMDFYPAQGWNLGFTLSDGELTNATGGDVDRRAVSISGGRTSPDTDWQSKLEWREDNGAEQREQWVSTNRLTHKFNESWRIAARLNYADTDDELDPLASARFIEGNVGFAYRPWNNQRWGLFGRYTYLYDLATLGQVGGADYDQKSQVLSFEGVYKLDQHWEFAGKLARREGEVRMGRGTGVWLDSATTFAAAQVRYDLRTQWHALAEYRWLDVDDGGSKQGFLLGVDRDLSKNFRIGVGYNFTEFSDDLTDFDYDHKGWFLNLVGTY
ncbi:TonB-dependent receptor [Pseudoxanthomonas sp. PXM02]|nr:TonB-dependent receptor [Pseudoxanthomonas sp. PXM02]